MEAGWQSTRGLAAMLANMILSLSCVISNGRPLPVKTRSDSKTLAAHAGALERRWKTLRGPQLRDEKMSRKNSAAHCQAERIDQALHTLMRKCPEKISLRTANRPTSAGVYSPDALLFRTAGPQHSAANERFAACRNSRGLSRPRQ